MNFKNDIKLLDRAPDPRMPCYFCHGPTVLTKEPETWKDADRHHEWRTCLKCQTPDCSIEFNFFILYENPKPELINYWLYHNGFTVVIGVKHPSTQITEDVHKFRNGNITGSTLCFPVLMLDNVSSHITPSNISEKLKTILLFQ